MIQNTPARIIKGTGFAALWLLLPLSGVPLHAEISGSGAPLMRCQGEVGDFLWNDANANGVQDAGEPGIEGVTVQLYSLNGADNRQATTATGGEFGFSGLCEPAYIVDVAAETLPIGMTRTLALAASETRGVLDSDWPLGETSLTVQLADLVDSDRSIDLGFARAGCSGSIGDRVWLDNDADGVQDDEEPGIGAVAVMLHDPSGGLVERTTTGGDGRFVFAGVCPGDYRVDLDENSAALAGLIAAPTGFGADPAADSNQPRTGAPVEVRVYGTRENHIDFGFYQAGCSASITDSVYHDNDQDGIHDAGEAGIEGAALGLFVAGAEQPYRETVSGPGGSYAIAGLCHGDYRLEIDAAEALRGGATATGALSYQLTVPSDNARVEGNDFGFAPGCTGEIGDRVWVDTDLNGRQDAGEPGIGAVEVLLRDRDGSRVAVATTDDQGGYRFGGLCAGAYTVQVNARTLPATVVATAVPGTPSGQNSAGAAPRWVELDAAAGDSDIDFGYQVLEPCSLLIDAMCAPVPEASPGYACSDSLHTLSMVWDGEDNVRVRAYRGKTDAELLAEFDFVSRGDRLEVGGLDDSPDDIEWQVFLAGTDILLGTSRFRTDCDDPAMDGPEDCGSRQGDGKDDKSQRINDWLLAGVGNALGTLECYPPAEPATDNCSVQSYAASCESATQVQFLTFVYSGGGCVATSNDQQGKFQCSGGIDPLAGVSVEAEDGSLLAVEPGSAFTIPIAGDDTELLLQNNGGSESLKIHTSCSKPLAAGDVFGSLRLLELDGRGLAGHVRIDYELRNKSASDAVSLEVLNTALPDLSDLPDTLPAGAMVTISDVVYITTDLTNVTDLQGADAGGAQCVATDQFSFELLPPPPCSISVEGLPVFSDKQVQWVLRNSPDAVATIEQLDLVWPAANGKLKESHLDGEKFFDSDRRPQATVVVAEDLTSDARKRRLLPGADRTLTLQFEREVEASAAGYSVEAVFAEGCTAAF